MALAPLILLVLIQPAIGQTTEGGVPSAQEIASAVTFDRYDDSCVGQVSEENCPPISLYRVVARASQCRPANASEIDRYGLRSKTAFFCRFLSAVVRGSDAHVPKWRRDQAIIYRKGDRGTCISAYSVNAVLRSACERVWRALPSVRQF